MGGVGACAVLVPETCVGAVADGWCGRLRRPGRLYPC